MLGPSFDEALQMASELHRQQLRKGTQVSYLSHLLAVSSLVMENGGTEEEAIAALLHDAIEDAEDPQRVPQLKEDIRARFGDEVLAIVEACTDADARAKAEERAQDDAARLAQWRDRKQRYIDHVAETSGAALLVSACDKLHNARAIARDLAVEGRTVFERFRAGEEGTLWYYRSLVDAFRARVGDEPRIDWAVEELSAVVEGW